MKRVLSIFLVAVMLLGSMSFSSFAAEYGCPDCQGIGKTCSDCGGTAECTACLGTGKMCSKCSGTGLMECTSCKGKGEVTCRSCDGTGGGKCEDCDGQGIASTGRHHLLCQECGGAGCSACFQRGWEPCHYCKGSGKDCHTCYGSGIAACYVCKGTKLRKCWYCNDDNEKVDCSKCNATGICQNCTTCTTCNGTGVLDKTFEKYMNSDEYSDEIKAIASEAIEKIKNAETESDVRELTREYRLKIDVQEDKESMRKILASDEYSDEMKELAKDAIDELGDVTTSEDLTALWDKYNPLMRLQLSKDEARNAVKELLPVDASDAVKKIISDACDAIQNNDNPDQYDEIIENAKKDIEAQLQKENELAPAKEAAIAAINDAKKVSNASIAEEAIKAISNAQSEDEINTLKEKALSDMEEADELAAEHGCIDCHGTGKICSDCGGTAECTACLGTGKICKNCNGTGVKGCYSCRGTGEKTCRDCDGTGGGKCEDCDGQGIASTGRHHLLCQECGGAGCSACFQRGWEPCHYCKGSGKGCRTCYGSGMEVCNTCKGAKLIKCRACDLDNWKVDCSKCNATGICQNCTACTTCNGTGILDKTFEKYMNSDEYSDEIKAIASEAIEKIKNAETASDMKELAREYQLRIDVQEDKESMRKILESDEYSNEMKELAKDAIDELGDVTTSEELTALWDKYNPLMRLQLSKDEARKVVKKLLPADASDAVKKIISDACDEIQANDNPDQYDEIIEIAKKDVEAQLQKEKELAPAKEAAKKAIDEAVPADASDAVKAAAEKAKAAVDAATTIENVEVAKKAGLKAINDAKDGKYIIIDGANSTWTKGSDNGLQFRSNAPFAKFDSVKIDGKTIAEANYTAKEGSTIIKLKPAYLETLKLGKHSIEIASIDGSASTNFTVKPASGSTVPQNGSPTAPQTGDSSNILIWMMLLSVSGVMLMGTVWYRRKRI